MVWFYLSGLIIILGGEINALLVKRKIQNVNDLPGVPVIEDYPEADTIQEMT